MRIPKAEGTRLLIAAKNGDMTAKEELVRRLEPIVRGYCTTLANKTSFEYGDLYSEFWIAFFGEHLPRVELRGDNPLAYVIKYSRLRIIDMIEYQLVRAKVNLPMPTVNLDSGEVEVEIANGINIEEDLELLFLLSYLRDHLSDKEFQIVYYLMLGYTFDEVSKILKVSSPAIAYHIRKIRLRVPYFSWFYDET